MVRCKFSIFFLLSLLPLIATAAGICPESFCGILPVKFPFLLTNRSNPAADRCMYPGFGLSCGPNRSTAITLPNSGQFTVSNIEYDIQSLWINDPDNCLPKRFLDGFSLRGSPFYPEFSDNYTFLNCSSTTRTTSSRHIRVDCMSDENHTVFATPTVFYDDSSAELASSCEEIATVLVPVTFGSWLYGLQVDVRLSWSAPLCGFCDYMGRACGFISDSGLEIRCFNSSRSDRPNFRVIIAIGLPILACIIGVGFFIAKSRAHNRQQRSSTTTAELSNFVLPRPHIVMAGLDGPTIESYPKTLLGESRRLPKPSDNTCPICLCEYQPKESLRTLPKCGHYFHAGCIDEWLRVNASCPLCRDLPPELVEP